MTRPMRIAHAVCSAEFAGVEQLIRRLAIAQARVGHEVTVLGGSPEMMADSLARAGVSFRPAVSMVDVARSLHALRNDIDVVNTHMTAADGAAVVASWFHRRPLVSTRHFAQPRARFRPLGKAFERRIDAEIAVSRAVADAIGVRSTVVHPGVDPVPSRDVEPRERVILMAQRLQPEKHTAIGIHAFALSGLAAEGWRLVIAGEGPDLPHLAAQAQGLGIDSSVSFLGFRRDVGLLMGSSSLLLATCPFEHLGLTVLEAMAAGLPVVAADAGGHAELLTGIDRRTFFPPDDAYAAAANLRALASEPAARDAIARAARARQVAEFSLSAQESATLAVYRRAMAVRGR